MTRTAFRLALAAIALCILCIGCRGEDDGSRRGSGGKADSVGSCAQSDCDGPSSSGGCFCDPACAEHGDCCQDYEELCAAPAETDCAALASTLSERSLSELTLAAESSDVLAVAHCLAQDKADGIGVHEASDLAWLDTGDADRQDDGEVVSASLRFEGRDGALLRWSWERFNPCCGSGSYESIFFEAVDPELGGVDVLADLVPGAARLEANGFGIQAFSPGTFFVRTRVYSHGPASAGELVRLLYNIAKAQERRHARDVRNAYRDSFDGEAHQITEELAAMAFAGEERAWQDTLEMMRMLHQRGLFIVENDVSQLSMAQLIASQLAPYKGDELPSEDTIEDYIGDNMFWLTDNWVEDWVGASGESSN